MLLMLGPVEPTPYDLRFPFLGIPVRVHPLFWVIGAVMGWGVMNVDGMGFPFLLAWIACLFVSILVHEMGHALTAVYFGYDPEVILYHFGGLAVYRPGYGHTMGRSIAISFAGPAAGFVLAGIVYGVKSLMIQQGVNVTPMGLFLIRQLLWINLIWGAVNLLPVLPLDGGRISQALLQRYRPRDGMELCCKLGILAAVGVAFFFFTRRDLYGLYPVILFAFLAFSNVQMLQMAGGRRY